MTIPLNIWLQDSLILVPTPEDSIIKKPDNIPDTTILIPNDSSILIPEHKKVIEQNEQANIEVVSKPSDIKINKIIQEVEPKVSEKTTSTQKIDTTEIFHYPATPKEEFQFAPRSAWHNAKSLLFTEQKLEFQPHEYIRSHLNWTLFIGFFSIVILLGLKSYYRKFVTQVINTMVNFQLADKLLREKNIIVRRAFFMLNLNFLLILSLFIMLLMEHLNANFTEKQFINYLIILGIITGILLIRLILYYIIAFIFEWIPAINQQIHSGYLINKNIGLILLPIVFAAIYTTPSVSKILLFIGLVIFLIASVFKLVRSFQIILRNGILLFYAFLYLCTLELLPWVLSSKLIIYLR